MSTNPTSPNGTPIVVRPIAAEELDRIVLRCWPERETLDHLFAEQATIGIAAWEGDKCVGQLHGYHVILPKGTNEHWPQWNNWWSDAMRQAVSEMHGPAWCHACIHVGRTLESARQETLGMVFRFARHNDWDLVRTLDALNALEGVHWSPDEVEQMIEELCASGQTAFQAIETQYHGRGIGTTLCKASVRWAREHGYRAVLAMGAPGGLYAYAAWSGHLSQATYARLGFERVPLGEENKLPAWVQGNAPPEVAAEAQAALAKGRPTKAFHERLMVLKLRQTPGATP